MNALEAAQIAAAAARVREEKKSAELAAFRRRTLQRTVTNNVSFPTILD
jgi:hypothetical protein